MRLTIFGSGYVGLVTGACMAETGNHVVCVDIDEQKIERLKAGDVPIYEPGLDAYIERNVEAGRLTFTTDVEEGVEHGLFQFIAVARRRTKTARQISSTCWPSRAPSAGT